MLKQYSVLTEADDADEADDAKETGDAPEDSEGDDSEAQSDGGDMPEELTDGEDAQDVMPPDNQEAIQGDDPEAQADVDNGIFISDNKKAEFAKMMLDALMSNPPKTGEVPQQYLNVTTENSDDVINFIQSLLALGAGIGEEGEDSLSDELKGV